MIKKILEKLNKKKVDDTQEEKLTTEENENYEEYEEEEYEEELENAEETEETEEAGEENKDKDKKKLILIGAGAGSLLLLTGTFLIGGGSKKPAATPKPSTPMFTKKPIQKTEKTQAKAEKKPIDKRTPDTTVKANKKAPANKTVAKLEKKQEKKTVVKKERPQTTNPVVSKKPTGETFVEKKKEMKLNTPVYAGQNAYRWSNKDENNDNGIVKPANVFKNLFLAELDKMLIEKQKQLNELTAKLQTVEQAIEEKKRQEVIVNRQKGNVKDVQVKLIDIEIYGITCFGSKCSASTNVGVLFVGSKLPNGEKVIRITPDYIVTDKRIIKYY